MKNLVICSGNTILTAGFRTLIGNANEFHLTVCESYALVHELGPLRKADILLADVNCGISVEMLSELRAEAPSLPVVLWVDHAERVVGARFAAIGVRGILRKSARMDVHLMCLRQILGGGVWFANEPDGPLRDQAIRITNREREIIGLLTQGLRNKQLAHQLGITEGTVKVHLSNLFEKFGVSDRLELALLALKTLPADSSDPFGQRNENLPAGQLSTSLQ